MMFIHILYNTKINEFVRKMKLLKIEQQYLQSSKFYLNFVKFIIELDFTIKRILMKKVAKG